MAGFYFNVKNYNVTGDGAHDDTAAIQAVLNMAANYPGSTVYFPNGIYLISATLTIPGNTAIVGCGDNDGGTVFQVKAGTALTTPVLASADWYTNATTCGSPIVIKDIKIDGNSATSGSAAHGLVAMNYWSIFERISISTVAGDGFLFTAFNRSGSHITNTCVEPKIHRLQVRSAGQCGIHVKDDGTTLNSCTDGFLQDCIVQSAGTIGISVEMAPGWLFSGNHIYGTGTHGLYAQKCYATRCTGNYIDGYGSGSATFIAGIGMDCIDGRGSVCTGNTIGFESSTATGPYQALAITGKGSARTICTVANNTINGGNQSGSLGFVAQAQGTQIGQPFIVYSFNNDINNVATNCYVDGNTTLNQTSMFNVKDFGSKGDGTTDDTTAIQEAINQAAGQSLSGSNTTGGTVYFPWTSGNTYRHHGLVIYNNIHLLGSGATVLQLTNGANADSIQGYNAPSLIGGSSTGGIYNWSISKLTIDGNKTNQTSTSYGIRAYGYGFRLHDVVIRFTYSDGLRLDWNGGSTASNDSMEAVVHDCKVHHSGGIGVNWTGPHGSQFTNVVSFQTGSHAFYIGPNANDMMFTNCHGWGMTTGVNAVSFLVEGTSYFSNCAAEGSDTVQVVLLANRCTWMGGSIFSGNVASNNVSGLQIGQAAGGTPFPGSSFQSAGLATAASPYGYMLNTSFNGCEGSSGAINFANDGGRGFVNATVVLSGSANANLVATGSISGSTYTYMIPQGRPSSDGSLGQSGRIHYGINASKALVITDNTNDIFNFHTLSKRMEFPNASIIRMYSDAYITRTVEISNGTISYAQSSSAAAIGNGGTITTNNVGVARIAPTASVTGVILQAGTNGGQQLYVINESSSFSVTFAVSGTSNVNGGTSSVVGANSRVTFVWNSAKSLWY